MVAESATERMRAEFMWKRARATLKMALEPTRNRASHTLRAVCMGRAVHMQHMNHSARGRRRRRREEEEGEGGGELGMSTLELALS